MTTLDEIKIKAKYHISFYDTVYTIRPLNVNYEIDCSEQELGAVLDRIADMSWTDFKEFSEGFGFGDFDTNN